MTDNFEPRTEPARTIYLALQGEAQHRANHLVETWLEREAGAVHEAARRYAIEHGGLIVSMEDVLKAERSARGHFDYAAKWARAVAARIIPRTKTEATFEPPSQEKVNRILRRHSYVRRLEIVGEKVLGLEVIFPRNIPHLIRRDAATLSIGSITPWNPFEENADAFSLAAHMGVMIDIRREEGTTTVMGDYGVHVIVEHGKDVEAATRRAITRFGVLRGLGYETKDKK